jgi:hypothetical protein
MLMLVEVQNTRERMKGAGKYQGIQIQGSYNNHYISQTDDVADSVSV